MSEARPFLPFALPDIGEEEIAEVVDTLRSGWVTTGPKARRFEQDFAAFLGAPGLEAIAVNSATAGLHLALEALGIGPGDEVITTTHTFTATAEVARYLGADVVLVDVDPATLNLDPALVEAAITPRTKALVPVHYAGLAADMPALLEIARRHGLKVVEDAAHALPASRGGALVGTLASDATVFSFYANKTITTGEGGMVVVRDPAVAARIRVMRLHGISRDAFDRFTATAEVVRYLGADVVLVDVDPATLNIDPARVEAAITPRTKALVPVHYAGVAADMPALLAIARRHGLKVVEDACLLYTSPSPRD